MAQPTPYDRQASFTNLQAAAPSDPLPGDTVDAEFNAVKTALDETQQKLALIQDDDGEVKRGSIGRDQLDESLDLGFNAPEAWTTATAYTADTSTVFESGKFYRCLVSHISGVFATDLAASKWEEIADFSDSAQTITDMTATETVVASAATCDIGGAATFRVSITGTTNIASFGTVANRTRFVRFESPLTITYNATSLILPDAIDITVAANDTMILGSDASGNWKVYSYAKAADPEATLASASTCAIGTSSGERVKITGTTTITSFGSQTYRTRIVRFEDALTLTHGASLVLPGAADIVTAAGDTAMFVSDGSAVWRCFFYERASGMPLGLATVTVASATTTNIGTAKSPLVTVSGTTTVTSFGTAANQLRWVHFSGALTLTHNATSLILPGGANITTVAGDTGLFASDASGNWRCLSYQRLAATTSALGAVELATDAETQALSSTSVVVRPSNLGSMMATEAEMETATALDRLPLVGRMKFHPGVAKAWCIANSSGTMVGSYNVLSVTDGGVGVITFTIATDFVSTNELAVVVSTRLDEASGTPTTSNWVGVRATGFAVGGFSAVSLRISDSGTLDPGAWMMVAHGTQ